MPGNVFRLCKIKGGLPNFNLASLKSKWSMVTRNENPLLKLVKRKWAFIFKNKLETLKYRRWSM